MRGLFMLRQMSANFSDFTVFMYFYSLGFVGCLRYSVMVYWLLDRSQTTLYK